MIDWGAMLPAAADDRDNHTEADPAGAVRPDPAAEQLPCMAAPERAGDNRRRCSECANRAGNGRCLAAARRQLVASPTYAPDPVILRRCEAFAPLPDDPDQRAGRDRWPGL